MRKRMAFVALFFAMMTVAMAQSPTPNIATNAVCTHSSGGSGTYGPQNYNDGILPPNGSLPWGWTSGATHTNSSAWIMFEWTTPQTFGEITFHYGGTNNRYLAGAHIQYWNGSSWVTGHTYLFSAPYTDWIKVVSFAPITSTRVRITNWTMAPVGQTSNPNFREIEIRNVCTDPETQVSFVASPIIERPNTVSIQYSIYRPIGSFNATLTFRFYTPQNILVYSESTVVPYNGIQINGIYAISSNNLPTGFYRLEVTFNVMGICNTLEDVVQNQVIMVINVGTIPCSVYPGDINNDGLCNYADRSALNRYIIDANLRPTWLNGPARYRADINTNPLTFFVWEPQPSIPWETPDGCYKDADGNGTINGFDYIAVRLNWMKSHVAILKTTEQKFFDMIDVYPNPFNPMANIRYSINEKSNVRLEILSPSGKVVSVLENGERVTGEYQIAFDGSGLSSGSYLVVLTIAGQESRMTYTKTVKIVLSK